MLRAGALAVLIAIAAPIAAAQQPLTMRGRIAAAENDRPLRGSLVTPLAGSADTTPVMSDDEGAFELPVTGGLRSFVVSKAGYATTRIDLAALSARRRPREPIEIRLSKGLAISGRVVDGGDVPAIGARIRLQRIDSADDAGWALQTNADDVGDYRIGGLAAGRYALFADTLPMLLAVSSTHVFESSMGLTRALPLVTLAPVSNQPVRTVTVSGDDLGGVDITVRSFFEDVGRQAAAMRAQTAPRGRIEGNVHDGGGAPIAGALVRAVLTRVSANAYSPGTMVRTGATTDAAGRFRIDQLVDGDYQLEPSRAAHVSPDDASDDPQPMSTIRVSRGVTEPVNLRLSRGGAISGTVVDTAGDPLQGIHVMAMQIRRENGRMVANRTGWERLTDDRGRYRVFGLPSGSYLIVTSTDARTSGRTAIELRGFAQTYFPGTTNVESAQPVLVQAGQELTGLDLSFAPTPTVRIIGTAVDHEGQPLMGRVLLAISGHSGAVRAEPLEASVETDGSFEFAGVAPGDYVLQTIGQQGFGHGPEFGFASMSIADREPAPIAVRASEGATLEGRFVVEGSSEPALSALSLHAITTDIDRGLKGGRGPEGLAVHDDGRFYLTGLFGPMRFSFPDAPPGWYLKSVTIDGIDATDVPFDFGWTGGTIDGAEVLLSTTGATIGGSVVDRDGRRAREFAAVVFPTTRDGWFPGSRYVKQRRSSGDGTFDIGGLPPGDYWVAAVDRLPAGDWQIPEVLDTLVPGARRVTVTEGQDRSIEVRLVRRQF